MNEPRLGQTWPSKAALHQELGGNARAGITPLADGVTAVFSDDAGPYEDEQLTNGIIAYRGEGRNRDQTLTGGNKRLNDDMTERQAIRFFHKPLDCEWTFEAWVVIIGRGTALDVQGTQAFRQFVWVLAPVTSRDENQWPDDIEDLTQHPELDASIPDTLKAPSYSDLSGQCDTLPIPADLPKTRASVRRYERNRTARNAVLLRAASACENLDCGGQPNDTTDSGEAILEVDHIDELADRGRDHPSVMIALCPNCHAMKTRGSKRVSMQRKLHRMALDRHQEWL